MSGTKPDLIEWLTSVADEAYEGAFVIPRPGSPSGQRELKEALDVYIDERINERLEYLGLMERSDD